jgi:hypothetical protein
MPRTPKKRTRHTPDGRTHFARRHAAIRAGFIAEAGGNLTAAEISLVDTAAMLALRVEQMTAAMIRGEPIDNGEMVRIAGASRRALAQIVSKVKPAADNALQDHIASEYEDDGDADGKA